MGQVRHLCELTDDTFHVPMADDLEQIASAAANVIEVQEPGATTRHETAQPALALQQWQIAQVVAVEPEQSKA